MSISNATPANATSAAMSREETLQFFARRQVQYENFDAAGLAADYADDAVIESPLSGQHGKRDAEANLRNIFSAFMDFKMTPEAVIVDGTRVAQLVTSEGTNIGGLFGLPPSGKPFKTSVVMIYELRGRQIVREQRVYDFTGVLLQVGVLKAKPV